MAGTKRNPAPVFRFNKIVSLDIASVSANTTADQTFTVTGLTKDMVIIACVADPSVLNAGMTVSNAHVSAKDTLKIRLTNNTAGALNPAACDFEVTAL